MDNVIVVIVEEDIPGFGWAWVVQDSETSEYMSDTGGFTQDLEEAASFDEYDDAKDEAEGMGYTVIEEE